MPFKQPSNSASRANIYASDTQDRTILRTVMVKIHIVNAHHFPAVDVNHLLIEQIATKQKESFRAI